MDELRPRSETDPDSIARIRSASFPIARRGGYEKRAVERFLDKLAGWLESGGADEVRVEMIRHDLERAGDRATEILRDAERRAARLLAEAEQKASAVAKAEQATVTPIRQKPSLVEVPRSSGTCDLATGNAGELAALGLSQTQARRIVARREQLGGFTSLDELNEVPGIPAALLAEIKPRLTLDGAEPSLAAAA